MRKLLLGLFIAAAVPVGATVAASLATPPGANATVNLATSPPACPMGTNWDSVLQRCR
ncbi:hypothetical protein Dvina_04290 [Dactylosporangium vinaceum]|uniref:Uncharacterized protein n=1 Tax=Dactylosporangium vinaceum TaxID=53362 RepID=A0ABV5M0E3_9ACTN|nr:hypothetical protein [Dactylosporangium vinaceum]UAB97405.1 hypothetical protein Dvina_04290 [Dactylosporangium vinaceum]